jgi:archaellum component FlaC
MNPSTRGAAKVSIMWMISVGVVALVALTLAIVSNGDVTKAQDAQKAAQAAEAKANEARTQAITDLQNLSVAVGWNGESGLDNTSLTAMAEAKTLLRDNFDIPESDETFEAMLPKLVAEVNKARQIAKDAEAAATAARQAQDRSRADLSQITSTKDATIDDQKKALADAQSGFDDIESNLSEQLSSANDRVRELEEEIASIKAESRRVARDFQGQIKDLNAKNSNLAELTQPLRAPANLVPDGQILQVSQDLPLAWIDLGATNRLVLGTRFTVEGGNLGARHLKAWAEVIEVQKDMAKVRLFDQVDKFDPVVEGDYLVNPIYDPKGGYNAILVGRFTGMYGKEQLSGLLDSIGIRVQDDLDLTTNFMIVGSPILQDADGYPLEEPIEPSDTPQYQQAIANKVQVIPLASIQEFFVF